MNRFSRLGRISSRLLFMVAAAMWLQSVSAQVLEQVPSDAMIVSHLKDLQSISTKMAALAKQWGLIEMNPAMSDPLGYLLGQAKITEGLDKNGDAAIVLANGNLQAEPPPVILLIPVTDYQKFIANFAGAQKDGELDKFKMSFNGQEGNEETYATNWGHYAALSPTKDLLSKKPDGFKPSAAAAKEVADKDMVVIFNMKVIGPMAKEKIDAHKDQVPGQIDSQLGQLPQASPYIPLIKLAFTQGVTTLEQILSDTDCATFSVDLQNDGVNMGGMLDFLPDSGSGKNIASVKGTDGSLLTGLPAAKYLYVAGGRVNGDGLKKAISDFLTPLQDQLSHGNEDMQHIGAFVDAVKTYLNDQKGQVMGMIAPTGALGSPLLQMISVQQGDSQALIKDQQKLFTSQQAIMELIPNQPKMTTAVKPDAKTVDGVSFMQMTTTIGDGNSPGAAAAKQMINLMYGPGGQVFYAGAADDQHVLYVSGVDDAVISSAIKAAKDQSDPLSKDLGVTQVRKHLPQTRLSEGYLNVGDIITTAITYAKMFGIPLPVTMKANLTPMGMSVATEGASIRGDLYVPSDLIEQIVAMALQFNMGGAKNGGL